MPYATRQDLVDRYGEAEVAQRERVLPAGAVARALADADAMIDGYAAALYVTPLAPVPDNIPRVACQIARHGLLGSANHEQSRADYAAAVAWMRDVAAGRTRLVGVTPATGEVSSGAPSVAAGRRVFGEGVGF